MGCIGRTDDIGMLADLLLECIDPLPERIGPVHDQDMLFAKSGIFLLHVVQLPINNDRPKEYDNGHCKLCDDQEIPEETPA